MTVTADCPSGISLSCASGVHGLFSSSSAIEKVNFPGCPRVERSSSPGIAPSTLIKTRRIARPIVAFARLPLPRTLCVAFMPMSVRTGPIETSALYRPLRGLHSFHGPICRFDIGRHPFLVRPVFILRHAQLLLDLIKRVSRARHRADTLQEQSVIALAVVEDFHRSKRAVSRNYDFGIQGLQHLNSGEHLRNRDLPRRLHVDPFLDFPKMRAKVLCPHRRGTKREGGHKDKDSCSFKRHNSSWLEICGQTRSFTGADGYYLKPMSEI